MEAFLFAEDHGIAKGCACTNRFSTIEMGPEQQQELEACVAHNFAARSYFENAIKEFLQDLEDMKAKRNKEQLDFERAKKERKQAFANRHAGRPELTGEKGALAKAIDVFLEELDAMETQNNKMQIVFEENKKETKQAIALLENSLRLLDMATRRHWKVAVMCLPSEVLEPALKKQRSHDQA